VGSPIRPEQDVAGEQPGSADPRREQRNEIATAQGGGGDSSAPMAAPPKPRQAQPRSNAPRTRAPGHEQETASRKPETVATGLPGTGSRPLPSRSYRGLAWANDNVAAQSGQERVAKAGAANGNEEAVNVVTDDGASDLELPGEDALAVVDAGAETGQTDPD